MKSQELYKYAKTKIPGGTQLLSKRPEMFLPDYWPAYYSKAKGCHVWDLDDIKYTDMSYMGLGSCILGYADEDVNNAVKKKIDCGSMSTLNCPEEVELADLLCQIHPWASKVRYARTGGEAVAIAVRIARAKTGKDVVLFCGYHGWSDWYLSANLSDNKSLDGHLLPGLSPKGVVRGLTNTAIPFRYNDVEGLRRAVGQFGPQIGAIVMEPLRNEGPTPEFVEEIKKIQYELNTILVIDEITMGFRLGAGGAHLLYAFHPDIAVFAKGISNGFPMAAIIGTDDVMDVAEESFISSTYWTEGIGPTAAVATINKCLDNLVYKHLRNIGTHVQNTWVESAFRHGLDISVGGIYPISHFSFNYDNPMVLKTLFTQLMLEKGFLANTSFYASFAHSTDEMTKYAEVVDKTFEFISKHISDAEKYLKGPVCHSGFFRLT